MSINEVIKFIYSNTTDDYIIVDCQILEELVKNLKNNTKPIYPLDEIKGVIADIKASLPINKEMENTLKEFVAKIDSKFFNGDKIEESSDTNYVIRNAIFDGITFTENGEIITSIGFMGNFNKGKKIALDYNDEYSEGFLTSAMGRLYFHIENGKLIVDEFKKRGEYDPKKAIKKIKKSAKIPNIGYRKMGDIIAKMNWDNLDSVDFKNMRYRLDDFYVDERFFINQKDYIKAFNKCEDNPKMLGKEVSIKATRLADNQPLTIICELDERADVEKLYMYDFNIVEVMLDTF